MALNLVCVEIIKSSIGQTTKFEISDLKYSSKIYPLLYFCKWV